jgi:NAD(P)-dependent dehydrogenase (short-subunit alcohol dehydrogenase family)
MDSLPRLDGRVCVVTGASRGAGRAIATVLGEAGASVYITARSTRVSGAASGEVVSGTLDDTVDAVEARGGTAIPVICDATDDEQVARLFTRIRTEHGRLDLLVNNAWAGYEGHDFATFTASFWEQPQEERWRAMFEGGVRTHFIACRHAAPLMIERRGGLIISTVAWAFGAYLGNLFYDVAKAAIVRMVFGMATELRPHEVVAVALAPGFMRTERVIAAHDAQPFDLSSTESPEYLGRAVLYLGADPDVLASKTGQVLTVGDLAREYGFHDVDGSQPEPFRLPVTG